MTRSDELMQLLHDLRLASFSAARLLSRPESIVTAADMDDYINGRRIVPGWVLSWLEWEAKNNY